jgi:Matrixin
MQKATREARPHVPRALGEALRLRVAGLFAGVVCCVVSGALAGESVSFKTLRLEGNGVRWQIPANGQPRVVTYAVAEQDVQFAGARNCGRMTVLKGLLSASQIDPATLREEISAAFAMWEAVTNIRFREAATPVQADILIGAQADPEGWAFANVFYDTQSPEAIKPISRSLICLNPEKRWKVGFDGDLRSYDLRYTITHEIGHAIGLDHPSGAGQIMGYRYEETFRSLQPGDIAGAVVLYGKRQPEGMVAASEPLASVQDGGSAVPANAERSGSRAFPQPSN